MTDFLLFVDEVVKDCWPMHVEIYYSKIMDWCIKITRKGCATDYPGACIEDDDVVVVSEQDSDMQLCFAKAHVALKEWLLKFEGGY